MDKAQEGVVKPGRTHIEWSTLVGKALEGVVKQVDKVQEIVVKTTGKSTKSGQA